MKNKFVIPIIFALLIATILGILVYFTRDLHERNVISSLGYASTFNTDWYITENGTPKTINAEWLDYYTDPDNGTVSIYHALPATENGHSNTLALRTSHIAFDAYLNDELCYSYGMHNSGFILSKSPGWAWHFIELPSHIKDGVLRLDIKSFYMDGSESITAAHYGKSAVVLRDIILENLPGFALCILLAVIGLAYMIMHIVFNYILKIKTHIFYMGVFMLITSLWSMMHTSIPMLFINNTSLLNLFESIMLMIIPIALMLYVEHTCTVKYKRLFVSTYLVLIVNFISQLVICSIGIYDFHEMADKTYSVLVYVVAILLYTLYSNRIAYRETHEEGGFHISFVLYSSAVLCIAAFVDMMHISISAVSDGSAFTRSALLLLAAATGTKCLYEMFEFARQNNISQTVRALAYTDALTGLGNRTSFTDTLSETELSKRKYETLAVFIFDVNYLKYVNDNFGHQHGDKLIISCADTIKDIFASDCKLFRIGGDEFAAIYVGDLSNDSMYSRIEVFNNTINQYNFEHRGPFELSVAVGVAFMNSSRNETMDELFKRADRIMYDNKKAMKKNSDLITI